MPSMNVEQVKIWKSAHAYIKQVSKAYKAQGDSSMSMTALISQACFSIPMPNGHFHPEGYRTKIFPQPKPNEKVKP